MVNPIDYSVSKFTSYTNPETLALIREVTTPLDFKKGAVIENRGDPVDHIFLIEEGLVQLGINGIDGARFNLARFGAGHTFGEAAFFLKSHVLHDAHAQNNVTLRKLSHANIDYLMDCSIDFSKALIAVASMRVQTTLSYIGDKLNLPLRARLAKQILSVSASAEHKNIVNLRQVDLAHSLGVSRVSVGKTLKELSDESFIKIGYGKLEILSRSGLTELIKRNDRQF